MTLQSTALKCLVVAAGVVLISSYEPEKASVDPPQCEAPAEGIQSIPTSSPIPDPCPPCGRG